MCFGMVRGVMCKLLGVKWIGFVIVLIRMVIVIILIELVLECIVWLFIYIKVGYGFIGVVCWYVVVYGFFV